MKNLRLKKYKNYTGSRYTCCDGKILITYYDQWEAYSSKTGKKLVGGKDKLKDLKACLRAWVIEVNGGYRWIGPKRDKYGKLIKDENGNLVMAG